MSKSETLQKNLIKIVPAVVLAVTAGCTVIADMLVRFALVRKKGMNDVAPKSNLTEEDEMVIRENDKKMYDKREEWFSRVSREKVSVVAEDGLRLKGELFIKNPEGHNWLIAVHGYTMSHKDMFNIAAYYGEKGYNILTPDLRSHGESDGKMIGMGWPDRKDMLTWIDYIIEKDREANIILHGVSMGAATVMMTAGEKLPPQVKGIVEDCGYTSVWDIFADELKGLYHLPEFPILHIANIIGKIRAGIDFREASALNQVKKASVPMLFIHGSADNFVHTDMVHILYDACPMPKDKLIIDRAGHASASSMNPELYFKTVFDFLERECIKA